MACFVERAKVEKQYAQQLSQWSNKWKSIVESRKYEQTSLPKNTATQLLGPFYLIRLKSPVGTSHLHMLCFSIFCSSRASLRLPNEGMAVFLHLHRTFVCPPLLHCSVAHRRRRRAGEDLAEGDVSQENLLWVQGEPQQQHKFFTSAETLVQKAAEGPAHICHFLAACLCKGRNVNMYKFTFKGLAGHF